MQACGESRHTDRQAEMTETMNGTHYALLLPHLDNITRVFCLIHVLYSLLKLIKLDVYYLK